MGSSASTPNRRPRAPIRSLVFVVGDDHPKRCTGRRLLHRGLAFPFGRRTDGAFPPVVLDPFAAEPLSIRDRPIARRGGLLAIDCSWNRLSERGRLGAAEPGGPRGGVRRRLPFLLAANPQHYGRVGELNTAEALAAALFLLGEAEAARTLLAGFPGGPAFFELNGARLEAYAHATSPTAVGVEERRLFSPG